MKKTITLDVREDIRGGREPFSKIMNAAAALQIGERLLLIAPFEPMPLFRALENQGFSHTSRPAPTGEWEVLFTRQADGSSLAPPSARKPPEPCRSSSVTEVKLLEVDARGLEPPQPLVKILETLAELPDGAELDARTDRRPMHLYAQLEERGFTAESLEQPDGSFLTHVRRR